MNKNAQKNRMKVVLGAVIFGGLTILLLFLSIGSIKQYNNMDSLRKDAVVITDGKVLPENEGKLVVVSGRATADESTVSDMDFDVTVESPYLSRRVEMRQWVNSMGFERKYANKHEMQ